MTKRAHKPRMQKRVDPAQLQRYRADPVAFISECLVNPETGKPYVLFPAEIEFLQHALQLAPDGRLKYSLLVYSAIKKSGKTVFAAIIVLTVIVLFGERFAEAYSVANDFEQAQGRVFEMCRRILEASPMLRREVKIGADKIMFTATGASITALATNYASAAGGHPTISVFDELWGYVSERSHRLWDELVPVPTRKVSCRLVVSHAGFAGESTVLEELHKRGMALPEIGTNLHAGDGMLMAWHTTPISPLQSESWLAEMRQQLRPNQYLRMIENKFVTSEGVFIDPVKWEAITEPNMHPEYENRSLVIDVGIDASVKSDHTAIMAVHHDGQRIRLITHRIFKPNPNDPIDFEAAVEATLVDLNKRFTLRRVYYDPYQMQSTAQRLARRGIHLTEFPQSPGNLTRASQNFYELVIGRGLVVYEFEDLRLAVSRAVAVETARGWRIAKEKQSHKIDAVVALAMACLAAVEGSRTPPEPPIVMPFFHGKNSGPIGHGVDAMPAPVPEPAAAALDRPMTDIEKMAAANDSARASIPPHYLKNGPAPGWAAGMEQRSIRDRWSVPFGW